MEYDAEMEPPEQGEIFDLTNGEKVKIIWDNVSMYKSADKAKATVVTLGYGDYAQEYKLNIGFIAFDNQYEEQKKLWREYWDRESNSKGKGPSYC